MLDMLPPEVHHNHFLLLHIQVEIIVFAPHGQGAPLTPVSSHLKKTSKEEKVSYDDLQSHQAKSIYFKEEMHNAFIIFQPYVVLRSAVTCFKYKWQTMLIYLFIYYNFKTDVDYFRQFWCYGAIKSLL